MIEVCVANTLWLCTLSSICINSLPHLLEPSPCCKQDLSLFWALDGGVEMTKLFVDYGADVDARSPKDWTPLSYAQAKGKYGATEEKVRGPIYPYLNHPHLSFPASFNFLYLYSVTHSCTNVFKLNQMRPKHTGDLPRGRPPALWRQGLRGGRPARAGHPQPKEQLQP